MVIVCAGTRERRSLFFRGKCLISVVVAVVVVVCSVCVAVVCVLLWCRLFYRVSFPLW